MTEHTSTSAGLQQERPLTVEELDALHWAPLESSQLKRAAWVADVAALGRLGLAVPDASFVAAFGVMLVEFHGKRPSYYAYAGVPAEAYAGLVGATSAGKHLNLAVKGRYPFLRLDVEAPDGE